LKYTLVFQIGQEKLCTNHFFSFYQTFFGFSTVTFYFPFDINFSMCKKFEIWRNEIIFVNNTNNESESKNADAGCYQQEIDKRFCFEHRIILLLSEPL